MRIIFAICVFFLSLSMYAQKKELNQAEAYLKSGKDFEKAEKLMSGLLKDSANKENLKIYQMLYRSVVAQYEAANEKLYLKQKYDTTQFFSLVQRIYQIAEAMDSIDAKPDKKGRVRPVYRKKHAQQLDQMRRNIYYGGTFQMRKGNYDKAYGFFDTYLDTDRQPLFKGYGYLVNDSLMVPAAYWATSCAYQLQRPDSLLRYAYMAEADTSRREYVLQYVCEAYRWQRNDSAYVASLRKGFGEYPEHPYFFPRLADWYTAHVMPDSVLAISDRGLKVNADNQLYLLAKSVAQLNLNDDEGCIKSSERLIALNDTLPEPYFNIATVYLNQALSLEMENEPRKNRKRLIAIYQNARPYMEAYRKLAPDQKRRWAPALYRIYLNLNMGKQFSEIDRILNH